MLILIGLYNLMLCSCALTVSLLHRRQVNSSRFMWQMPFSISRTWTFHFYLMATPVIPIPITITTVISSSTTENASISTISPYTKAKDILIGGTTTVKTGSKTIKYCFFSKGKGRVSNDITNYPQSKWLFQIGPARKAHMVLQLSILYFFLHRVKYFIPLKFLMLSTGLSCSVKSNQPTFQAFLCTDIDKITFFLWWKASELLISSVIPRHSFYYQRKAAKAANI